MERITSNDDLTPGKWYWCRTKGGVMQANGKETEPGNWVASQVKGGMWKSIMDGMWCDRNNDQALGIYEIYGPIPVPNAELKGGPR